MDVARGQEPNYFGVCKWDATVFYVPSRTFLYRTLRVGKKGFEQFNQARWFTTVTIPLKNGPGARSTNRTIKVSVPCAFGTRYN
jgi:hypothetical protein